MFAETKYRNKTDNNKTTANRSLGKITVVFSTRKRGRGMQAVRVAAAHTVVVVTVVSIKSHQQQLTGENWLIVGIIVGAAQ